LQSLTEGGASVPATAAEDAAICQLLLRELANIVAHPDDESAATCDAVFEHLAAWPADTASEARVECLLAVAHCRYLLSQPLAGLGPARAAVELARQHRWAPVLRKSLTFLGVTLMDSGDLPEAIVCLSEALDVAGTTGDAGQQASVWNNLGLALQRSAQYADAGRCFECAADLAADVPGFMVARRAAIGNLADCALHLHEVGPGLRAARKAIELNAAPVTAQDCLSRAIAESNLARLMLLGGDFDGAARHGALSRDFARRFPSPRGEVIAEMTDGLIDVHRGECETGLTKLKLALESARRRVPSEIGDALAACVAGYEAAAHPDVALVFVHEMLARNREGKPVEVLLHHRQHLDRVDRDRVPAASIADTLGRQQDRLRGRLGDDGRVWMRNRILLLEQQSVAAELHDDTTGEHCYRVGRLASILGREIGLEDEACFLIDLAARLHDIGKLVVPSSILQKPGRLGVGEREIMETHAAAGAQLLAQSNIPQMHVAEEIARHHHERWDGGGYPARLERAAIPIAARVTALADVFDALTHRRPYKPAWTVTDALDEIRRLRGAQFDPDLTDVFLALVPRLQREAGDLDTFLGAEARKSPLVQARRRIAAALDTARAAGPGSLSS